MIPVSIEELDAAQAIILAAGYFRGRPTVENMHRLDDAIEEYHHARAAGEWARVRAESEAKRAESK